MKFKLQIILTSFLLLECALQVGNLSRLYSQNPKSAPRKAIILKLELGFSETGTTSPLWQQAIQYLRRHQNVSISFDKRTLSQEETLWAKLIKSKILSWSGMIDSLRIPFKSVTPPNKITILIGNQGGEDAFTYADSTICFDLNRLSQLYGSASEIGNRNRIDRFFAHEFTHVLHKAWRKEHPIVLDTPLDEALWGCLTEGLGNYRSLSSKWVLKNGKLTEHAQSTLRRLQPVFVQRIAALEHATSEEAVSLMEGLSMGPFEQKWGALTVALWLAQEAKSDDSNLQKWVDAGPSGILLLAKKYLPVELNGKMPMITHK